MKRLKILVLLLIICCSFIYSYGQACNTKCKILHYNRFVNLAEMAIIDSSYKKAKEYYDTAFCQIRNPFARDQYNAAVCDAILFEYEDCKVKILKLLSKGLNLKYITENTAFTTFLHSKIGHKVITTSTKLKYDVLVRNLYDSLFDADQLFRKINPTEYMNLYKDTVCVIDAANVHFMNELISKFGWPSEELIGITDLNSQPFDFIVIHQCEGSPCRIFNYSEMLRNAYENCQIDVQRAAYLIMRSSTTDDFGEMFGGLVTIVYDSIGDFSIENLANYKYKSGFFTISDKSKYKINEKRLEFGLESVDELRLKMLFVQKDNRFYFSRYGGNSIFTFETKVEYDNQIKNLVTSI